MKSLLHYWEDEDGLTSVEYALLLGVLVIAAITAWRGLGDAVGDLMEENLDPFPS
jgi:Flp pilus assembly pilin Flp